MLLILAGLILWLTGTVDSTVGLIIVVGAVLLEIVEIWLWIKYLKRFRVRTGAEGMVGERAVVIERCDPVGTVRLLGEIWNARCEAGAMPGDRVVVDQLDGLTVIVSAADHGAYGSEAPAGQRLRS